MDDHYTIGFTITLTGKIRVPMYTDKRKRINEVDACNAVERMPLDELEPFVEAMMVEADRWET